MVGKLIGKLEILHNTTSNRFQVGYLHTITRVQTRMLLSNVKGVRLMVRGEMQ